MKRSPTIFVSVLVTENISCTSCCCCCCCCYGVLADIITLERLRRLSHINTPPPVLHSTSQYNSQYIYVLHSTVLHSTVQYSTYISPAAHCVTHVMTSAVVVAVVVVVVCIVVVVVVVVVAACLLTDNQTGLNRPE